MKLQHNQLNSNYRYLVKIVANNTSISELLNMLAIFIQ